MVWNFTLNVSEDVLYLLYGENVFGGAGVLQQRAELHLRSHLNTNRKWVTL